MELEIQMINKMQMKRRHAIWVMAILAMTTLGLSKGWSQQADICPSVFKYLKMVPQDFKPMTGKLNAAETENEYGEQVFDAKKLLPGFQEGHVLDWRKIAMMLRYRSFYPTQAEAAAQYATLKAQLDGCLNADAGFQPNSPSDAETMGYEASDHNAYYVAPQGAAKVPAGGTVELFYYDTLHNGEKVWQVEIRIHE